MVAPGPRPFHAKAHFFDPSPESRAVLFLIGDHELHPDVNVNFQMSPSMAGSVFHGVIMS